LPPPRASVSSPNRVGMDFGRTKSPENASSGYKCRLVPAKTTWLPLNAVSSAVTYHKGMQTCYEDMNGVLSPDFESESV